MGRKKPGTAMKTATTNPTGWNRLAKAHIHRSRVTPVCVWVCVSVCVCVRACVCVHLRVLPSSVYLTITIHIHSMLTMLSLTHTAPYR